MALQKITVTAPKENCSRYITAGKEYDVINFDERELPNHGRSFMIRDDKGFIATCLEKNCSYLNGGNWTVNNS